ncbi:unnamed protein product [Rhizoctonia solani]|uniref:Asteroid domain-containing protein n=1 Tax=Rhizoctonia solani TaxID=456999 RepID=A0A8H3BRD0_9AGAM|nr:unnamed protein product [Rhizoctonia solani]
MSLSYLLLLSTFAYILVCAVSRWRKTRHALAEINHFPGERTLFGIASLLGNILPPIPYVSLGRNYGWRTKHRVFEKQGTGIYPAGVKHVSYSRNNFVKNTDEYTILKGFGSNLLVVEGEEWKRQRRIAAPAFSDKNNRLVWNTAKQFVEQMIDTWGSKKLTIVHDVSEDLALPLSLCVIAKAGFGQDISVGAEVIPAGHNLTFKDALSTASKTMHLPLMLPNWAWGLRKDWRHAKQAHKELRLYLREMIRTRRELKEQQMQDLLDDKYDLFNQLVGARDAKDMLSEDELIGNVFIFLIAGHETTAHTFAIILDLLALYPEVQEKLAEQLRELEREHGVLNYSHIHLLTYAMAVVYESLRLFPMVGLMPKIATADTTITVGFPPFTQTLQVPASTKVEVFSTGLHYDPSYWEDPDVFNPDRFMDPHWNRDAFIAFSLGPRACIGRRFAETTLVAELATLISKYKVSIDESRFEFIKGESILERRSRLIKPESRLTLSPAPASLIYALYYDSGLPWVCGGEYERFAILVKNLVNAWIEVGLEPYFVFDGPVPLLKTSTTLKQYTQSIKNANIFFRTSASTRSSPNSLASKRILPPLLFEACLSILKELSSLKRAGDDSLSLPGVHILMADDEADPYCVALAGKLKRGLVLGLDSDFSVLNVKGYGGYIPLDEMSWSSLSDNTSSHGRNDRFTSARTKQHSQRKLSGLIPPDAPGELSLEVTIYHPHNLASYLELPPSLLPLFGALVGNDFSNPYNAKQFFEPQTSSAERIWKVARALSVAVKELGDRGKEGARGDGPLDVTQTAVSYLLVRPDTVTSGTMKKIVDQTVAATLECTISLSPSSPSSSCAIHAEDECPLSSLSPEFLNAYREGKIHPRLVVNATTTGIVFPKLFLEDPGQEPCGDSCKTVWNWVWAIFTAGGHIPFVSPEDSEFTIGGAEPRADDNSEVIDAVEESTVTKSSVSPKSADLTLELEDGLMGSLEEYSPTPVLDRKTPVQRCA